MKLTDNVRIFQSAEAMAEASGKYIVELAKHTIDTRGRFVIALSGGHTPEQLYTLLSKTPLRDEIPWNKTFIFWGDERYVPSTDKRNNAHMAKALLLDHVDIPSSNTYPVPVELPPAEAAKKYERTVRKFFGDALPRFDFILLGLGENGHTASLFPGSQVIDEDSRLVQEVYVPDQKMFRITMTAKLINQAHNVMFLVEGEGKAEILNTVLTAPYQPDKYPAQLIKPIDGELYWFVDYRAANLLSK